MRLSIVKIVFLKELREMLRDRRSLTIMFGIPLVLYPILLLLIGTIGSQKKRQFTETPARVAVINPAGAPQLVKLMSGKDSGVDVRPSEKPDEALYSGALDAIVTIPENAEADALAGREPQIQ